MTPKEKAFSLYAEYASRLNDARIAKRCALIAVDEIINNTELYTTFWQEVKEEIKKL